MTTVQAGNTLGEKAAKKYSFSLFFYNPKEDLLAGNRKGAQSLDSAAAWDDWKAVATPDMVKAFSADTALYLYCNLLH
jgi:hypothetical protein